MASNVAQFEESWADVRRLTYEFMDHVPEEHWTYSPHPRFAPLNKQMRHMVGVQGVYHQGFRERRCDFGAKHAHYTGSLDKASLVAAPKRKDEELAAILDGFRDDDAQSFEIDFFGRRRGFSRYGAIMIQHEALHYGQWSFYATLGGFDTPVGWKMNWGL